MVQNAQVKSRAGTRCLHCSCSMEAGARFCGECGASMHRGADATSAAPTVNSDSAAYPPSFAKPMGKRAVDPRLSRELGSLLVLLFRERVFLIFHYVIFSITSSFGLWLAIKCYTEFHGDDVSKLMMAVTPLLFVNLVALVSLTPIKGTKNEIARIEEKIAYVKFQIKFKHIL